MTSPQSAVGRRRYLIGLIEDELDAFERGERTLASMVSGIEATITPLQGAADAAWLDELTSAWSGLETVHAVMLDEDRLQLSAEDIADVHEVIRDLRSLLERDARAGQA